MEPHQNVTGSYKKVFVRTNMKHYSANSSYEQLRRGMLTQELIHLKHVICPFYTLPPKNSVKKQWFRSV